MALNLKDEFNIEIDLHERKKQNQAATPISFIY
jgi:hypothetical protein